MPIYYIGSFPPIYGGVTIKNKNLYEALAKTVDIRKIDMNLVKKGNVREILRLLWAMVFGRQYVIGLAGQKNRRQFTKFLYTFKRRAMNRSVLMVMGGIVDDVVEAGPQFLRKFGTYRCVYVELQGMAQKLQAAGMQNVDIYPNARPRPESLPGLKPDSETVTCVYFSMIRPEKGVDLILQAAEELPQIQFHFYGEIDRGCEQNFLTLFQQKNNLFYHGVFTGSAEKVYQVLSQYDVLLLPTRWKAEGLPGILIEAKISGVPAIVSDHNFNREIVVHDVDGIVMEEYSAECLKNAILELDSSRDALMKMRLAGRKLAEQYYIDNCVRKVEKMLQKG